MIARKTPLRRAGPMARGARPKPVNRKRRASAWQHAFGSRARVRYVTTLPCAACGYCGAYPRQNAHTANGGLSRKGHCTTIIPLCGPCHTKQHGTGWLAIGMTAESCRRAAALTEQAWQARGRLSETEETK